MVRASPAAIGALTIKAGAQPRSYRVGLAQTAKSRPSGHRWGRSSSAAFSRGRAASGPSPERQTPASVQAHRLQRHSRLPRGGDRAASSRLRASALRTDVVKRLQWTELEGRSDGLSIRAEARAGGHYRRRAGAHGRGDLLGVDPLQGNRGRTELGVAELALDDVQRNALASELERVRVAQLLRLEAAPDHGRPRVGPSMMQNSSPTGSSACAFSHGRRCSQPHWSMPTPCRPLLSTRF
jgi:hypothetical protein